MCLVLAPSVWLEAWGMVVTEALLRGVPCIVSDAGEWRAHRTLLVQACWRS